MNIESIKTKITAIMGNQSGKILTAKKIGKRNEYLFSIGETNYGTQEIIFENEQIIVFGEELLESVKLELIENLKN